MPTVSSLAGAMSAIPKHCWQLMGGELHWDPQASVQMGGKAACHLAHMISPYWLQVGVEAQLPTEHHQPQKKGEINYQLALSPLPLLNPVDT